jgi:hypothetical protein
MVTLPTKAICQYQCINHLHMLACDPLSFAKLLWPLVESFHASMIEITYTHIYMLTPTPRVMQNMPSIHHTNKYSKVQRDFSSCILAKLQKERGVIEIYIYIYIHIYIYICIYIYVYIYIYIYMLKKHRKNVLQSKSIEKKSKAWPPLQNKSKRRILKQGVLRKKYMSHTLAHLNLVAWLVSSWIRSLAQQHHVAQVSLILILPRAPLTSHRVGSWGSFKSLWWGNKYHLSD